ncbi:MAG: hypothetical protein K0R76_711 [Alphaproteobacteria bacterium]|nr:hypothetical protein [Alphaproteobacteria bacterium]
MAKVIDVASYILGKISPIPAMKLQKLVYYSQAWSLVWDDAPLFEEPIEAWANGPVVRDLFDLHKGEFLIKSLPVKAHASRLTSTQQETIDAVLKEYGNKSSQWLSDLTHLESPWINARQKAGLVDGERGNAVITHDDMYQYYSAL